MSQNAINWPDEFRPENCAVHVTNAMDMDVSMERVWNCLVRATEWPDFYPNASNVKILDGYSQQLDMGTRFRWKTFNMTIETTVTEFEPYERLAWEAHSMGMHVYHAWLITPRSDGCRVVTEETQNGLIPLIGKFLMPGSIYKQHQIWLETLCEASKK